jgi:hypothetical protein
MQVLAETIDKCSCDDDCACEALTLKQGGIWNPVHTNASKCLQIGRSPEVMLLHRKYIALAWLWSTRTFKLDFELVPTFAGHFLEPERHAFRFWQ